MKHDFFLFVALLLTVALCDTASSAPEWACVSGKDTLAHIPGGVVWACFDEQGNIIAEDATEGVYYIPAGGDMPPDFQLGVQTMNQYVVSRIGSTDPEDSGTYYAETPLSAIMQNTGAPGDYLQETSRPIGSICWRVTDAETGQEWYYTYETDILFDDDRDDKAIEAAEAEIARRALRRAVSTNHNHEEKTWHEE